MMPEGSVEEVIGSGGSRRLGGSKHEALEAAGSFGGSRKLWRRSKAQRQQARSFGGSRMLWRQSNALEEVRGSGEAPEAVSTKLWR